MSRAASIAPVAFLLVGAAVGISWAMLYRQEPQERAHVYLDDSLPPAMAGAAAGLMFGGAVSAVCRRWPGLNSAVGVLIAALLCASVAAPMGWIVGDSQQERAPCAGMLWGACCGAGVGIGLALVQWFADYRRVARSRGSQETA